MNDVPPPSGSSTLHDLAVLLGAVAWPVAAIVIAIILREDFGKLLARMSAFKKGDFEANFEKQVDQMAAEAPPTPPSPQPTPSRAAEVSVTERSQARELVMLSELAAISPPAAILEAWKLVETALHDASSRLNLFEHSFEIPTIPRIIEMIKKRGLLGEEYLDLLERARHLRNEAVHAVPARRNAISTWAAQQYATTALSLVFVLESMANSDEWPGIKSAAAIKAAK